MYPLCCGLFLNFSTHTVVCLFHLLSCSICLDHTVLGLFREFESTPCVCRDRGKSDRTSFFSTRDDHRKRKHRVPVRRGHLRLGLLRLNMSSESGRNQILAKWQEAFTRLNGNQPGITGLMTFTKVCGVFLLCPDIFLCVKVAS